MTLLLYLLLATASVISQDRTPDLAGVWAYVPRPAAAPDTPPSARGQIVTPRENPSFGREFVARQSATILSIERSFARARMITEYRLDGTDSRNKEAMFDTVSTVSIQDGRISIVTVVPALSGPGQDDTVRRMLWIDGDGKLQVDVTVGGATERSTYVRSGTDLSGHWVQDSEATADSEPPLICGRECVIAQSPTGIVVKNELGENSYEPAKDRLWSRKDNDRTIIGRTTSEWRGPALFITSVTTDGGVSRPVTIVARLELRQDFLVIAVTRPTPPGGGGPVEVKYRRVR